jgi:hypothetical protein
VTSRDFCWVAVLVLNVGSAMLAPKQSARGVGAMGAAIALLWLGWRLSPGRGRARLDTGAPIDRAARRWVGALVLAFAVPFASPWLSPRVGFWSLDWRAQLILAWLAFAGTLLLLRRDEEQGPGVTAADGPFGATLLPAVFLGWSAAFWLTVVWDLGLGTAMLGFDRSLPGPCRGDPLTNIFRTWEAHPASQHLFLGWRAPGDFESRTVYVHHVHPYLLTMYAYVSLVQASTGVALHVATNLTPFLSLAAVGGAFGTLLVRSGALRRATDARGLLELFLGVGFVVTTWRFWFDLLRYNSDSAFPLLGSLFVLIWACLEPPPLHGAAMLASLALVALAPLYAPFLIVAVACLPGSSGWTPPTRGESAWVLRLAAACSVLGLGVYLLPRALAGWKGYQPSASSWLFRSGLDGDTTYFTSILQAFVKPCSVNCCGGRAMLDVVFPAFVPLVFGLTLGLAGQPAVRRRLLQGLIWLAAPYGFSLVLLPQAVSIHPYLYDHLLIVPFVILGAWSLLLPAVRERLRGVAFLAYLVVMIGLIMSNLVKLAQELTQLPR